MATERPKGRPPAKRPDKLKEEKSKNRLNGSNVRPVIARALWNGLLELSRRSGKTLPEIVADQLDEDFNKTLTSFSKFLPSEPKHHHHTGNVESGIQIALVQYDSQGETSLHIDRQNKQAKLEHKVSKPSQLQDQSVEELLEKYRSKDVEASNRRELFKKTAAKAKETNETD